MPLRIESTRIPRTTCAGSVEELGRLLVRRSQVQGDIFQRYNLLKGKLIADLLDAVQLVAEDESWLELFRREYHNHHLKGRADPNSAESHRRMLREIMGIPTGRISTNLLAKPFRHEVVRDESGRPLRRGVWRALGLVQVTELPDLLIVEGKIDRPDYSQQHPGQDRAWLDHEQVGAITHVGEPFVLPSFKRSLNEEIDGMYAALDELPIDSTVSSTLNFTAYA